jgi:uncharacterized protein
MEEKEGLFFPMVKSWYADGLSFGCTECGKCCTGSPGYVFLEIEDIERLCKELNLDEETFLSRYTRKVGKSISLLETEPHYDCILLKDGLTCSVYKSRPTQCRTFPFWPHHLTSKKAWQEASLSCEGMDNPDGTHFTEKEILNFFSS